MSRMADRQRRKKKKFRDESMSNIPVPGRKFIITGPEISGTYSVCRISARKDDRLVFYVEGDPSDYDATKHKFQPVLK